MKAYMCTRETITLFIHEKDCFKISKYRIENGATAAVRRLTSSHPDMKESTI